MARELAFARKLTPLVRYRDGRRGFWVAGWGELRESWRLEDVLSLPGEEHDYFERKAAGLLAESDCNAELGKQMSAFANSGGGHLVIGVSDSGVVEGVPEVHRGRTRTREWLEQLIPTLTEPSVPEFRVHAVPLDYEKANSDRRVVLVIDIGDSWAGPHQSVRDKRYYQRAGGHSIPASHHYLELVRSRRLGPALAVELQRLAYVDSRFSDGVMYLDQNLVFVVQNFGRSASYRHEILVEDWPRAPGREDDYRVRERYPYPGSLPPDQTILPSVRRRDDIAFDLMLRMSAVTVEAVIAELDGVLPEDGMFQYRVASENSPGEPQVTAVSTVFDRATLADRIVRKYQREQEQIWGRSP